MQVGWRIYLALRHQTARPKGILRGKRWQRHLFPLKIPVEALPGVAKRTTFPAPHFLNILKLQSI